MRRAALLVLLFSLPTAAATFTWTGAASNLWSNPLNWSPNGTPGAADTLRFTTAGSSTNDFAPGSAFSKIVFDGATGYAINGNAISLSAGINANGTIASPVNVLNVPVDVLANESFVGGLRFNAPVDVHAFTLKTSSATYNGGLAGNGTITGGPIPETLVISGANSFSGSLQSGVRLTNATMPAAMSYPDGTIQVVNNASLTSITTGGGIYIGDPSTNTPASLSTNDFTENQYTTVVAFLNGATPGSGYSQMTVNGNIAGPSGQPDFSLNLNFTPVVGTVFTIIANHGTTNVPQFEGLPEGSTLTKNGVQFRVSYMGGTGRDFILTALTGAPPTAPTSTTLHATPNASANGEAVMLTATVTSESSTPVGSVTFFDGNTSIGNVPLVNGSATISTSSLAPGSHNLKATYSPSSNSFATSTSSVVVQQVDACPATPPSSQMSISYFGLATGCRALNGVHCAAGEQIAFMLAAPGYTFQSCDHIAWSFGDSSSGSGTDASHVYTTAGTFTVTATVMNARGTSVATTSVTTLPTDDACVAPSITGQPANALIAPGMQATLNVIATGTTPFSYTWFEGQSGDTSHPIAMMSMFTTPHLGASREYWVRVTNGCGHADSATALVTVITRRRGAGH